MGPDRMSPRSRSGGRLAGQASRAARSLHKPPRATAWTMRPGTLARNSKRDAKGASMNTSARANGAYVAWLGISTRSMVKLSCPSRFGHRFRTRGVLQRPELVVPTCGGPGSPIAGGVEEGLTVRLRSALRSTPSAADCPPRNRELLFTSAFGGGSAMCPPHSCQDLTHRSVNAGRKLRIRWSEPLKVDTERAMD